jgi:DNA repair photolyase
LVQLSNDLRALQVIAQFQFPVHIITKSDLVLKDLDTLLPINQVYLAVSVTIATTDDNLGRKVEPGTPLVSQCFRAMGVLTGHGILKGVTLMPVLPFIEDQEENIAANRGPRPRLRCS